MKCIILAAGYATRLYPLTENFPKPLLEVNGKKILDWLLEDIDQSGIISEYIVVSNNRYVQYFTVWRDKLRYKSPVVILDDESTANENRLGAVKDILFAIEKTNPDDDLLVIAGDNLLDFSLQTMLQYYNNRKATCVLRYFESEKSRLSKSGVLEIDDKDRVIRMEEKPAEPFSNWCTPPFYIFTKMDIALISKAIDEGCGTDAPGSFISWLCGQTNVYAMEMPGKRFDIGNLESYRKAQDEYKGIVK